MGGDNQNQSSMLLQAYSTSTKVLQSTSEYLASYKIGQYIFKKFDRLLWTIEKSSQWSIPYAKEETLKANGENGQEPPSLIRPLPWILFLPFLLALSIFRKSSNFCAIILGFESRMTAESIITYIQSIRRQLRHIRYSALQSVAQQSENAGNPFLQKLSSMLRKVYDTLISAICVPGMASEESFSKVEKDVRIVKESETDTDDESNEETMEAFLAKTTSLIQNRLSQLSTSIDDDYVPGDEESNDEDSTDSSEEEFPIKPKVFLQKSITNQIIAEENEDSDVSNTGEVKKPNGNVCVGAEENHINDPQVDVGVKVTLEPDVNPEGEKAQENGELINNETDHKQKDGENKEIEGTIQQDASEIKENGQEQNGDLTSESCQNNEIFENGIAKSDINKNESFIRNEQDFQQSPAPVENGANHHENH